MRLVVVGAALAAMLSSPVAAAPWDVRVMDGKDRAAVSNAAGSMTVSIFCGGDGAMVGLTWSKAVPWTGEQPAELVIDGETFPITAFREGETWGVFNLKPKTLKPAMVGALRSGSTLVIGGSAVTGIAEAERTFTLEGSSRALDAVPGGCT